ncbi:LGFP repeat-containing protein [Mycobacterium sp. IDR2000157661]|uniref:LGFP repeat-containing protein n=1 Tax=Mycobacterium sp. IDR2000157661 TaxID=2867005 RepID=UPI001EEA89B8|nr:hypothetical protein [Mycobacterium sp. IDR2000157661]ULE32937.1 hypothetical protein K3G64_23190 [Mycobacterium sp. IDR2000157661]
MSGRDTRRTTVLGRLATGLVVIAAALVLAPVAAAQPEADANAAITAAWEASGGAGGPLGPKQGDVYRAGEGFAQNYTGGKMFFTPATGAHYVQGAILEKYESLGGPADSDLGFPTIDEGPGRAPQSRNSTFSASDNPVIFWTPATGAHVVRGAINAAWDALGGSSGVLGVPTSDETFRGDVVSQTFTGGELSYNMRDKTFTTVPPDLAGQLGDLAVPDDPTSAINAARRAAGGPLGPLGAAEGPPYPIGKDGLAQDFAGGKIFYSPATGARVVTGQVLAKYESVGGPEGDLGFPATSEVDGGLATESRMVTFAAEDKPVIFWTPDYGAVIVRGAMKAAWAELDGAAGPLGAPVADQSESGDVVTQRFSGGVINWDRSTREFTTEPPDLAAQLSDLQVPGEQAPGEAPASPQASDSDRGWFEFSWWWLLALVPVLMLIGLVVFAAVRSRRGGDDDGRGSDRDPFGGEEFDDGFASDVDRVYSAVGPRETSEPADDYSAAMFGDRYASEGMGAFAGSAASPNPWEAPRDVEDEPSQPPTDQGTDEEDPDAVDTAPTPVVTGAEPMIEHDPLTDTGRHARIEIDEPEVAQPAFRLPLGDSDEAPEGYPVKADTQTGRYWSPGSAGYDDVRAEIWFSSEEFAVTNGFVRGD